ncbi:hypothetical protein BSR00_07245 [Serratia liquefaciens]|nr:hypothetical protein BSR00_07245 [Serratia liquefaciens]RYM77869.1 hypothetical protein BSR01_16780 [Serratia liquefaciens]
MVILDHSKANPTVNPIEVIIKIFFRQHIRHIIRNIGMHGFSFYKIRGAIMHNILYFSIALNVIINTCGINLTAV